MKIFLNGSTIFHMWYIFNNRLHCIVQIDATRARYTSYPESVHSIEDYLGVVFL